MKQSENRRVLHVIRGLTTGGMEKGVLELVMLARQEGYEDGFLVFDVPPSRSQDHLDVSGIPIDFIQRDGGFDYTFAGRLRAYLKAVRPSILHAHNDTALFYAALSIRRLPPPRPLLVATYHNYPAHPTSRARWAARWAARHFEWITVVSAELGQRLRREKWLKRAITVHNGIDASRYHPEGSQGNWLRSITGCDNGLVVGHVGRFDCNKRQADLVEAFRLLRSEAPGMRLVFVGGGPTLSAVRNRAEGLPGVLFIESILPVDMPAFLRELDMFAICSEHEGLPRALLEAMATGLAAVATRTGGIPELLQSDDYDCGLMVPVRDPIALADALLQLQSPHVRSTLGECARKRVLAAFSVKRTFGKYEQLYRQTLGDAPSTRRRTIGA